MGVRADRRAELLPGIGDLRAVCDEAEGEEVAAEKVRSDSKYCARLLLLFVCCMLSALHVPYVLALLAL